MQFEYHMLRLRAKLSMIVCYYYCLQHCPWHLNYIVISTHVGSCVKTSLDNATDIEANIEANIVDDYFQRQIAKKKMLVQSMEVSTWLSNITFHLLLIWLQTLVAINSELRLSRFQAFAHCHLK